LLIIYLKKDEIKKAFQDYLIEPINKYSKQTAQATENYLAKLPTKEELNSQFKNVLVPIHDYSMDAIETCKEKAQQYTESVLHPASSYLIEKGQELSTKVDVYSGSLSKLLQDKEKHLNVVLQVLTRYGPMVTESELCPFYIKYAIEGAKYVKNGYSNTRQVVDDLRALNASISRCYSTLNTFTESSEDIRDV